MSSPAGAASPSVVEASSLPWGDQSRMARTWSLTSDSARAVNASSSAGSSSPASVPRTGRRARLSTSAASCSACVLTAPKRKRSRMATIAATVTSVQPA